ncbi:MAG: Cyclic pyranopterin monophosphate synthase [bacterium ADurb.Bin236]|nr:MAG: Cyclic pyranopterin monophosphate synthase [bacterium ADurb.Bin236]HPN95439.1 radical SAM protein [bacterium]
MLELARRYPLYLMFRQFGFPVIEPLSLAVSVTNRCNFACATCNVSRKKPDEMSAREYDAVFKSFRNPPRWITLTGGEPFMRRDIEEVATAIIERARPDAVTIASNASFPDRLVSFARAVASTHPNTSFIVNLSVDGIGPKHDKIRGHDGSFSLVLESLQALKELEIKNMSVGFHTVISRFNSDGVPKLIEYLKNFEPDFHRFEPAQRRAELGVQNKDVEPAVEDYEIITDAITSAARPPKTGSAIIDAIDDFRRSYYELSTRIMKEKTQVVPCYAGMASGHIAPNGDIWACCTLAKSLGNVREKNYNFSKVWGGPAAAEARRFIRDNRCYCPMANACYTNMFLNIGSLGRIAAGYFFKF